MLTFHRERIQMSIRNAYLYTLMHPIPSPPIPDTLQHVHSHLRRDHPKRCSQTTMPHRLGRLDDRVDARLVAYRSDCALDRLFGRQDGAEEFWHLGGVGGRGYRGGEDAVGGEGVKRSTDG